MQLTLTVPDELATRLRSVEDRLPEILEMGLREFNALPHQFEGWSSVLEELAALPSPEDVLALRPSPALQERISALLEKHRTTGLSAEEESDWERLKYLEHLVRLAKARAALKIKLSHKP